MPYALCPMPYAHGGLCPMPMSTSYESSKGYILSTLVLKGKAWITRAVKV